MIRHSIFTPAQIIVEEIRTLFSYWRPQPDAGTELRRAEADGRLIVHGEDPATCRVELLTPAIPTYVCDPCLPIAAWLTAWHVAHLPQQQREHTILRDMTQFRAGVLVVARLDICDASAANTQVMQRIRFDEMVTVAHQWFLLLRNGVEQGMQMYMSLLNRVRREDVELEARLALAGIAFLEADAIDDDDAADDSASARRWE